MSWKMLCSDCSAFNRRDSLKRIKLTVAYDGTNYCGWQIQPNGLSVEQVLNQALQDLFGEQIRVIGASRTDAGVHALGNVAVFDTDARMPADKVSYALNTRLPEDIRIVESGEVPADFHPRFCESRKTYSYRILNRRFPDPCRRLYSYFYHWSLDVKKMQRAASYLVGPHDFSSFCTVSPDVTNHVRTVYSLDVMRGTKGPDEDMIVIRICGNGFLYNMVRIIVGTLIRVGGGMIRPEEMGQILAAKDRHLAGDTAPAQGLILEKIEYPDENWEM